MSVTDQTKSPYKGVDYETMIRLDGEARDAAERRLNELLDELVTVACTEWGDWYGFAVIEYGIELRKGARLPPPGHKKKRIGQGLRMRVYERDDFTCRTCGARKNLSLDHVIPEILGGESTFENLQTLCRLCNTKKGKRVAA